MGAGAKRVWGKNIVECLTRHVRSNPGNMLARLCALPALCLHLSLTDTTYRTRALTAATHSPCDCCRQRTQRTRWLRLPPSPAAAPAQPSAPAGISCRGSSRWTTSRGSRQLMGVALRSRWRLLPCKPARRERSVHSLGCHSGGCCTGPSYYRLNPLGLTPQAWGFAGSAALLRLRCCDCCCAWLAELCCCCSAFALPQRQACCCTDTLPPLYCPCTAPAARLRSSSAAPCLQLTCLFADAAPPLHCLCTAPAARLRS